MLYVGRCTMHVACCTLVVTCFACWLLHATCCVARCHVASQGSQPGFRSAAGVPLRDRSGQAHAGCRAPGRYPISTWYPMPHGTACDFLCDGVSPRDVESRASRCAARQELEIVPTAPEATPSTSSLTSDLHDKKRLSWRASCYSALATPPAMKTRAAVGVGAAAPPAINSERRGKCAVPGPRY